VLIFRTFGHAANRFDQVGELLCILRQALWAEHERGNNH